MSVVVDASLVLALALPLPYSEAARSKMAAWKEHGEPVLAPALWEYEVTTALRRAIWRGLLTTEEASLALRRVAALNIQSIAPREELHRRALSWAERLGQSRAYDAQYLALAEQSGASLWTGDKRLANGAQQAGAAWVRWVGEAE